MLFLISSSSRLLVVAVRLARTGAGDLVVTSELGSVLASVWDVVVGILTMGGLVVDAF